MPHMKSKKNTIFFFIILFILIFASCSLCTLASYFGYKYIKDHEQRGDNDDNDTSITTQYSDSLALFSSDSEFDAYLEDLQDELDEIGEKYNTSTGLGDVGEEDAAESPDASITNVQESGVDEGDIVKAYKDYLVILRRGKIFTVEISDTEMNPISKINAYPEGFTSGTWYDEMLISDDTIVVVGYSYELSATEIELFSINDKGELTHKDAYFIDSNDYYSSRNYASRLVDGELIFYMPYYMYYWNYNYDNEEYTREFSLPKIREWVKGNDLTSGEDILEKTDIYKPVQESFSETLHTVVRCDIDNYKLDCNAKAILGPYSRTFYVSPNAIYVWVTDDYYWFYEDEEREEEVADAYVYQFLLEDSSARVLKADGSTVDQFSFKEENGYLNVLVREYTEGDAMWNPESTYGEVALLRTKLDNFTNEVKEVSKNDFTALPTPEGYTMQNRFVGDFLLYGTGSGWYYDESSEDTLYVKNYKNTSSTQEVELNHGVDRIEVMGEDAVVIGTGEENLYFTSIELGASSKAVNTYRVKNAVQGETRSHGFFYHKINDDKGILGLPIRQGYSYEHLFSESAKVIYLNVDDLYFERLGVLEANPPREENDNCSISCVDWYGNSRPIFYSDRIFALLGYEIVKGQVADSGLEEIDRINFNR
jgi:hypothetical protein